MTYSVKTLDGISVDEQLGNNWSIFSVLLATRSSSNTALTINQPSNHAPHILAATRYQPHQIERALYSTTGQYPIQHYLKF